MAQLRILWTVILVSTLSVKSVYAEPLPKSPTLNSPLSWILTYSSIESNGLTQAAILSTLSPEAAAKLNHTIAYWQSYRKQARSERKFISRLFKRLHKQELRQFTEFTGLDALLKYGEYNCLSATTLYGIILSETGFKVRYLETSNHICLLVTLSDGSHIMLESTSPSQGIITDKDAVNSRIQELYAQSQRAAVQAKPGIFQVIGFRQLLGLSYFNQAAWQANHGNKHKAEELAVIGEQWYPAYRFRQMRSVLAAR
jgi:hypothetical protein